jgi:hypothetical protein
MVNIMWWVALEKEPEISFREIIVTVVCEVTVAAELHDVKNNTEIQ